MFEELAKACLTGKFFLLRLRDGGVSIQSHVPWHSMCLKSKIVYTLYKHVNSSG